MTFEKVELGNVSKFFNNLRKPVTRSNRVAGEYRYFGAAGIQDYVSEYLFDGDFILVGEDGTVITEDDRPMVQQVSGKFWVNNHAHVIQPNEMADFDYLYFAISSTKVRDLVTGAVQPKLSMTNLKQLQIPWAADSAVRLTIGSTLRSLDEKIASNNQVSKTLEDIAQTIFKSWFIDFDPVKAKMAGEKPAGMDAALAALFPDAMEDSELGLIPNGWNIKVISDFGKVVTGKTPSTKVPEYWGDQIPFVTIPDMHGQILVTSTARALSKQGADSQRSQNVPAGSTMVTCIATPGLVGYATKNCQTNQQINSVIPSVEYSSEWLFWHLRGLIPTLIRNSGIGTVFANLNKSDFSKIKSITPTMALRNAFNDVVEPIVELLETLNHESQYLRDIRNGLLPRLISGELQIPEEMLAS
jgi:type I restriction enzyme S subunit